MEKAWELAVVSEKTSAPRVLADILSFLAKYDFTEEFMFLPAEHEPEFIKKLELCISKLNVGDSPDSAEQFIQKLLQLVDTAIGQIRRHGRVPEKKQRFFVRKLQRIKSIILYPSVSGSWSEFTDVIGDAEFLDDLYFIADSFEEFGISVDLNEDVETFIETVRKLTADVSASSLGDDVKRGILVSLSAVLSILNKYQVYGFAMGEEKVKILLGDILVDYKELSSSEPELTKNLLSFASKALARLRTTSANIEAAKSVAGALNFEGM